MLGVAEEAVRLQRFKPRDEFLRKDVAARAELQFDEFWWPDNLDIPVPGECLRQVPRGKAVLGVLLEEVHPARGLADLVGRDDPLAPTKRSKTTPHPRSRPSRGFQVLAPSKPGTFCKPRSRLQRL